VEPSPRVKRDEVGVSASESREEGDVLLRRFCKLSSTASLNSFAYLSGFVSSTCPLYNIKRPFIIISLSQSCLVLSLSPLRPQTLDRTPPERKLVRPDHANYYARCRKI
jgi:hypothetical protein